MKYKRYHQPPALQRKAVAVRQTKYDNVVKVEFKKQPKGQYQIVANVSCKHKARKGQTIKVGDYYNNKPLKEKLKDLRWNAKAKYGGRNSVESVEVKAAIRHKTITFVKIIRRFDDAGRQQHYRNAKGRFIKYSDVE